MKDISSIYSEYFEFVYKYLYSLTLDADISEELAQETFLKAILNINSFKQESKISTWLCEIAKNLWYNYCKKQRKHNISQDFVLDNLASFENIEYNFITKEEHDIVINKINSLDDISRKVIYFRVYGNMSFKEIGKLFDKSENWARVVFYRAKNKIKEGDFYE